MGTTGIILAGGKSSRFQRDKTQIAWNHKTLTEDLAARFAAAFDQVLIVSSVQGKFQIEGTREAIDLYPGMGPLGGIHAGLLAAEHEACFVTACDMPFFDGQAAKRLLAYEGQGDIVAPVRNGRPEPLFAVYHRRLANQIETLLCENRLAVRALFDCCQVRLVQESEWGGTERLFYNINYPEDYTKLYDIANKKEG